MGPPRGVYVAPGTAVAPPPTPGDNGAQTELTKDTKKCKKIKDKQKRKNCLKKIKQSGMESASVEGTGHSDQKSKTRDTSNKQGEGTQDQKGEKGKGKQ